MRIALFLTFGSSLQGWANAQILSRELALYKELAKHGIYTTIVSYGDERDNEILSKEDTEYINILCRPHFIPLTVYQYLLPYLHKDDLSSVDIIKTNQFSGADVALRSAKALNKKLIIRMGHYNPISSRVGGHHLNQEIFLKMLKNHYSILKSALLNIVPTSSIKNHLKLLYGLENTVIIPNNVDLEKFKYKNRSVNKIEKILFIGRLEKEKNIKNLILALDQQSLTIVGQGSMQAELEQFSVINGKNVNFMGVIDHNLLPEIIYKHDLFILPSEYEGHPKVLIEAMACGIPVLVTNVIGNSDVIIDSYNGFICEKDAGSIRGGIQRVQSSHKEIAIITYQARQDVEEYYSLSSVSKAELKIYREFNNGN